MTNGRSFIDEIPVMEKNKAVKYIVYGIVLAIVFGTVISFSVYMNSNALYIRDLADYENEENYNNGLYGYDEYVRRQADNEQLEEWMLIQDGILIPIARIGGQIALFFVAIGFLGIGLNDKVDEKTRQICLIIGAMVTFIFVMVVAGIGISISIT
jgi:hypothetical protein